MPKGTKRNADHVQRHNTPTLDNEAIANQLEALLTGAIANQQKYYKQLGLRDKILNLSLMVAAVLTLLWRQVAGVQELTRLLAREDLLWCCATRVGNADDPIKYFGAFIESRFRSSQNPAKASLQARFIPFYCTILTEVQLT